jgi:hypothetical protein
MKPVRVHSDARAELDWEIAWYEKRHPGLGLALLAEFDEIVQQVKLDPQTGASYERRPYHFLRMRKFPFAVYFQEFQDFVWIAAVAHHRRRAGYWLSRKPDG